MIGLPDSVAHAASVEHAARALGEALGLDAAAPVQVTERALAEPDYARALMASRNVPDLRARIMEAALASKPRSAGKLAGQAAAGLLKWGMDGLKPAEPWVIARRLGACAVCPFHAPAPDTLVYRGAKVVAGKDSKICTSCNCLTNTKAAISTEHCPERDPDAPTMSRWGEPWLDPAKHPKGPW